MNEVIKGNISTERDGGYLRNKKKKMILDSSLKSIGGPSFEKTPNQKLFNASVIFDNRNRNNSPIITDY